MTQKYCRTYGLTPGCRGCIGLQAKRTNTSKKHNNQSRLRFYLAWQENADPKILDVRHSIEPDGKSPLTPAPDLDAAIPEQLETPLHDISDEPDTHDTGHH